MCCDKRNWAEQYCKENHSLQSSACDVHFQCSAWHNYALSQCIQRIISHALTPPQILYMQFAIFCPNDSTWVIWHTGYATDACDSQTHCQKRMDTRNSTTNAIQHKILQLCCAPGWIASIWVSWSLCKYLCTFIGYKLAKAYDLHHMGFQRLKNPLVIEAKWFHQITTRIAWKLFSHESCFDSELTQSSASKSRLSHVPWDDPDLVDNFLTHLLSVWRVNVLTCENGDQL